ncbi:MAG: hypothetical protein HOV67_16475 [Kribbellaceae bacterium]|nr:hypothetical protein [Kribbellaceae bacterium]
MDLLVTNRCARDEVLITMGELSSVVTDETGRVVGRFVGPRLGTEGEALQLAALGLTIVP